MRRLALALALFALPVSAQAAGMALRWNSCKGPANRTFACDRSTGSELLVGSFSSPADVQLSGVEVYIRITTADANIPAWWQMSNKGGCRSSSLSAQFDVSAETECDDPWMGQAAGGVGTYTVTSNGVDLRVVMAVPREVVQTASAGREYAAFRLAINHSRSNGAAACDGCATPACITIERMVLTQPVERPDPTQQARNHDVELTAGMSGMGGAANVAMWQGGTPTCGAGAAKPSTWSDLKRRYSGK